MTTQAFAAMARRHWKEWLPNRWAALQASGQTEAAVLAAAQAAQKEKQALMRAGSQEHEADEVVRAQFILLPPELEAENPDPELEAKEQEYQAMMQEQAEIDRQFDQMDG